MRISDWSSDVCSSDHASQTDAGSLDPELAQAYDALRREAGLEVDADLDDDAGTGTDWNANAVFRDALDDGARVLGGGDVKDAVLSPLRQLSFWQMKDRARSVGERGVAGLLRKLQGAASEYTRFHLMGHSFGCIRSEEHTSELQSLMRISS